jgi:taurine dioxygenase
MTVQEKVAAKPASSAKVQLQSVPLSWATGSEVRGLDLTRPKDLNDATVDALMMLLGERGVLLFRGQKLNHDQHLEFTRRFGPLAKTGLLTRYAPPGYPDLFTVTNMKIDGVRSETWNAARQWHSDQSFLEVPARACLLRCELAPKFGGGDTMFANMYQAYDGLSEGLKQTLSGMKAFHCVFNTRATVLDGRKPFTEEEKKNAGGATHPVVKQHTLTGRKFLFVNEQDVDHFDGWTIKESAPLLDYLYAHLSQPAYTYRHKWQPGDIIMWDNQAVQHNALADYDLDNLDAPENHRLMFRSTLA